MQLCALQILNINHADAILKSLRPALILGVRLWKFIASFSTRARAFLSPTLYAYIIQANFQTQQTAAPKQSENPTDRAAELISWVRAKKVVVGAIHSRFPPRKPYAWAFTS